MCFKMWSVEDLPQIMWICMRNANSWALLKTNWLRVTGNGKLYRGVPLKTLWYKTTRGSVLGQDAGCQVLSAAGICRSGAGQWRTSCAAGARCWRNRAHCGSVLSKHTGLQKQNSFLLQSLSSDFY